MTQPVLGQKRPAQGVGTKSGVAPLAPSFQLLPRLAAGRVAQLPGAEVVVKQNCPLAQSLLVEQATAGLAIWLFSTGMGT
jgi:hypothetical protein